MSTVHITTFYQFFHLDAEQIGPLKTRLEEEAQVRSIYGLVILGPEGFNATICGQQTELNDYKRFIDGILSEVSAPPASFKDSRAGFTPFRLFKVKIREEIVTLGDSTVVPTDLEDDSHLSPAEWDALLHREDVVCVDTRNWYETEMGHFKGALTPPISEFRDFPAYLEAHVPKDKTVLMYCTGGIRCEKAVIDARRRGYTKSYQLKGGILNYLKERPHQLFEGECFVFDNRVAVTQDLSPTQTYRLCPHCGQPAAIPIICKKCETPAQICSRCQKRDSHLETCSKNCAYHYHRNPHTKGQPQRQGFRARLQDSSSHPHSVESKLVGKDKTNLV